MKKEIRNSNLKEVRKKQVKQAKGITLVSLVVTIVILLILSGVTLSLTLGDRGIITQAVRAKEAQEIAAIKEDMQLALLDKELEKGGTGLTQEELEEIAGNYGELQEDGNTIKTDEGYEIKIDEIYKPGGTTGGDAATDEELAELQQKVEELEKTVEDLNNTKTELEGTIEDLNNQIEQEQGNSAILQEQVDNLTQQVDSLNKTIEQQQNTINDLNTQIASLKEKQSTGNATLADVLSGKTFSNSSEVGLTGTMPNRGAVSQSLNAGGSYTIPAGYHNGSGKVTANSLASQTSATAGAGQILNGYTAWVNGSKVTGTMPNRGNLNWSGSNTTYTVPAGYYSGGTLDSRPSYTNGYNAGVTAADNRANANSTNYKTGYNNGYNAGVNAGVDRGISLSHYSRGTACDTSSGADSTKTISVSAGTYIAILSYYTGSYGYTYDTTKLNATISQSGGSVISNLSSGNLSTKESGRWAYIVQKIKFSGSGSITFTAYGVNGFSQDIRRIIIKV